MTPRRCTLCRQEGHDRRKCPYTPEEARSHKNAYEPPPKVRGGGSRVMNRRSTTSAAAMADSITYKEKNGVNVEYTKEDEIKKREIWGYTPGKSAIDNTQKKQAMDHICGWREGLKRYDVAGSASQWNQIPCTNDENSGPNHWKKIPGSDKNLVYDFYNFTKEEIDNFDEKTKKKYHKLKNWLDYCNQRGAVIFHYGEKEDDDKRDDVICSTHEFILKYTYALRDNDIEWLEKANSVIDTIKECNKI